jgi:hypothetical protein
VAKRVERTIDKELASMDAREIERRVRAEREG